MAKKEKEPKLPAAVHTNELIAVDKHGMTIAKLDSKHMARAFLGHFKGYEEIARQFRALHDDPLTSAKVKFDILKFVATTVIKGASLEEKKDLDKLTMDDLQRIKDVTVLRLMLEGQVGQLSPENAEILQKVLKDQDFIDVESTTLSESNAKEDFPWDKIEGGAEAQGG